MYPHITLYNPLNNPLKPLMSLDYSSHCELPWFSQALRLSMRAADAALNRPPAGVSSGSGSLIFLRGVCPKFRGIQGFNQVIKGYMGVAQN